MSLETRTLRNFSLAELAEMTSGPSFEILKQVERKNRRRELTSKNKF